MKYIINVWKKIENAMVDAAFAEVGCDTICTRCK